MYPISGLVTESVSRRSLSARSVVGSCTRSSSARNTSSVFLFSVTVCGSTLMPAASAALSFGSAIGNSFAAGSRRRERSVKSARNGRCTRKLAIAVSSVGGFFSIVAWRQPGQRLKAANVSAILVNSSAWMRATGATCAETSPMFLKKSFSAVRGSFRLRITGVRKVKNGFRAWIAALMSEPRPANASP